MYSRIKNLNASQGWFIKLNQNLGEKCLSNSVLFYGDIYYTTFHPRLIQQGMILVFSVKASQDSMRSIIKQEMQFLT